MVEAVMELAAFSQGRRCRTLPQTDAQALLNGLSIGK